MSTSEIQLSLVTGGNTSSANRLRGLFVGDAIFVSALIDAPAIVTYQDIRYRWWVYNQDVNLVVYLMCGISEREGARRMAQWIV